MLSLIFTHLYHWLSYCYTLYSNSNAKSVQPMRIGSYLRQSWRLLRESPVLGFISIVGTGLSIGLITITFATQRIIPESDMYPAYHRDRMLFYRFAQICDNEDPANASSSMLGLNFAKRLAAISTPAYTTITQGGSSNYSIRRAGEPLELNRATLATDAGFWNVYHFDFIYGTPYQAADVDAQAHVVVIDESLAQSFYGNTDPTGNDLLINYKPHRILGVVKGVSSYLSRIAANAYIPYTTTNIFARNAQEDDVLGDYNVTFLAAQRSDFAKIRTEVADLITRFDLELSTRHINAMAQPDDVHTSLHRVWSNLPPDMANVDLQFYIALLILFLVPGINLIVISQARMRRRLQELGIRKSFGATHADILWQVLRESLLYTLLGAILGILLLLLATYSIQNILFEGHASRDGLASTIPLQNILSWRVILIAIISSLVLNIISMLVPAWQMARKEIVASLSIKK